MIPESKVRSQTPHSCVAAGLVAPHPRLMVSLSSRTIPRRPLVRKRRPIVRKRCTALFASEGNTSQEPLSITHPGVARSSDDGRDCRCNRRRRRRATEGAESRCFVTRSGAVCQKWRDLFINMREVELYRYLVKLTFKIEVIARTRWHLDCLKSQDQLQLWSRV